MSDTNGTLDAFRAELARAREKHPNPNATLAALVEEVGELARAVADESRERVRAEAIQVGAMALRIIEDGDGTLSGWRAARGLDALVPEIVSAIKAGPVPNPVTDYGEPDTGLGPGRPVPPATKGGESDGAVLSVAPAPSREDAGVGRGPDPDVDRLRRLAVAVRDAEKCLPRSPITGEVVAGIGIIGMANWLEQVAERLATQRTPPDLDALRERVRRIILAAQLAQHDNDHGRIAPGVDSFVDRILNLPEIRALIGGK